MSNQSLNLISKNKQIIFDKPNFIHELKYTSDEISQIDVSCMLYEHIFVEKIMNSLSKVFRFDFYFNVGIYGIFADEDDIHFNKLIKLTLEWYHEKLQDDLKILFEQDDILRFCIKRLFSYSKEKHTFVITIISVNEHKMDLEDKKRFWANPAPNTPCNSNGIMLTIWGNYPNDIPDSFNIIDINYKN